MATSKLYASPDFFKHLSLEHQQLTLTIDLLETFVSRALQRSTEVGDARLMLILDQVEVFTFNAKHLSHRLGKILERGVMRG